MKISAQVKQHDKFQIELKFVCPFDEKKKLNDSHIELFFFLPKNLAINEQTYQSSDFYKDFSEYTRFKTPDIDLEELKKSGNQVLQRLKESIQQLPQSEEDFSRHIKMYCSIVRCAMRDKTKAILSAPQTDLLQSVRHYIDNIDFLLHNYRSIRPAHWHSGNAEILYALADEYLSITANGYLFKLWKALSAKSAPAEVKQLIAKETAKELRYRKQQGYPSADTRETDLLYRESMMKKEMAGVLFLNIAMRKDGIFLENLLLALCAAVAMVFVTAISFAWKGLFLEEFSTSFFVVWVIAYMFKDRIKSQLQLFCLNRRSRYSYDYRQKIYDSGENVVGICREGFRYCAAKSLPKDIVKMRNRTQLSMQFNGSLEENVMLYRKKIELFGNAVQGIIKEFRSRGVVNIYRMNILHWTYKMDNSTRTIYDSDGTDILPIQANRDYHVNMVLRYGEAGGKEYYARYRLVLCRDGIRKIDEVCSYSRIAKKDWTE